MELLALLYVPSSGNTFLSVEPGTDTGWVRWWQVFITSYYITTARLYNTIQCSFNAKISSWNSRKSATELQNYEQCKQWNSVIGCSLL